MVGHLHRKREVLLQERLRLGPLLPESVVGPEDAVAPARILVLPLLARLLGLLALLSPLVTMFLCNFILNS